MTVASSDRLLRRTLWANAVFSVISGAILAEFAATLAGLATHQPMVLAGLDLASVFELLGAGVGLAGLLCGWIASRPRLPVGLARIVLGVDLAWVLGSLMALVLPAPWTTLGVAGIVVVALIVADFAVLEYLGLRRLSVT